MSHSKSQQLHQLTKLRQSQSWDGFLNIADFHDGAYECDYVSPYTKSAKNEESTILIMLQDWASSSFLSGKLNKELIKFGRSRSLPTNIHLESMLKAHFGVALENTYATNLFPFVKKDGMSATIPMGALTRAAKEFGIPQIKIVKPKLVIALGSATFGALRNATGLDKLKGLQSFIDSPFMLEDTRVWCQAHTGALGTASRNRGGVDRVSQDWEKMSSWFKGGV